MGSNGEVVGPGASAFNKQLFDGVPLSDDHHHKGRKRVGRTPPQTEERRAKQTREERTIISEVCISRFNSTPSRNHLMWSATIMQREREGDAPAFMDTKLYHVGGSSRECT